MISLHALDIKYEYGQQELIQIHVFSLYVNWQVKFQLKQTKHWTQSKRNLTSKANHIET